MWAWPDRQGWVALLLVSAAMVTWSSARADAAGASADLVTARLIAEDRAVSPGATLWLDLQLEMKPGWHTYWRNPGDSGLATVIDWALPPGFSAGEVMWPWPKRIVAGTIGTYGYEGEADLLVPIAVPAGLTPGGPVTLAAEANWLVCSDICIPGGAKLSLSLPATAAPAGPDPQAATLFAAARTRLPKPAPFATSFSVAADAYRLFVPSTALLGLGEPNADFFPFDGTLIDHAATPVVAADGDGLEITLPKGSVATAAAPATLDGLLVLSGKGGQQRAFDVSAKPAPAVGAGADGRTTAAANWWQGLALAFLGGIVLNLMPCVFPILSLKVLGVARQARGARGVHRRSSVAYALGVIVSFAALGGGLLAFRAGGQAVGWGFQLQSPVFVAVLSYLLFAIGLNLSGVMEIGGATAGLGGRLADKSGLAGSFLTGLLATAVATPCTAPFMGAALGLALIAPTPVALGIFLTLGFGLAFPYLLVAWVPGLYRILPKPGPWLQVFKQALAFPLYGTVAWLLWVLIQQVGPDEALGAFAGLVLIAFAAWVYGHTRSRALLGRRIGAGLAGAGAAVALLLASSLTTKPAAAAHAGPSGTAGLAYEAWSPAGLQALTAAHTPAFVNLTAAWCITCLVNERTALQTAAVRKAFAERGVVPLKGDWTNRNADITRFLEEFGRSGVPLYVLYDRRGEPIVLPQILREATLLDALAKL